MAFTSEVLVERTAVGQRQTVKEQGMLVAPLLTIAYNQPGVRYSWHGMICLCYNAIASSSFISLN